MTTTAPTAAIDTGGSPSPEVTAERHPQGALSPASGRQAEYRTLMGKWWFAAAVGAPRMVLSYPWLIPGLGDVFPRESAQLWWL